MTVSTCARCQRSMLHSRRRHRPEGMVRHAGRGLCGACIAYLRKYHPDHLRDHPRSTRSRDDLLDDYVLLRSGGLNWRQCAERLGMRYPSFERAMQLARAAGDPRAGRIGERWPVAS